MKKIFSLFYVLITLFSCGTPDIPENHNQVESRLYLGKGKNQPLIVGLGGSEGGNAWDSDRWKKTRDQFINNGYAFLALGYFGAKGTPEQLDRISIDAVHNAIIEASKNPAIDSTRIAIIGGSKGAELALLLASYYKDINCVVAIVPGYAAFPALTFGASTSSWTYKDEEVPFVPMPWKAVPSAINNDLRRTFEIMLEDKEAVEKALIKIENINGPILFVSARKDEMWPSTEMSEQMMARLKNHNFQHAYQHIAINGGHTTPLNHFDSIFSFLNKNFESVNH